MHDQVIAIDPAHRTVTLSLINGFSFGKPVLYISTDSSDPKVSAIEANTFAPRMRKLEVGIDDISRCAVERIFIATNGASEGGCNNPQRQGLSAALLDGHRPNNTFGGIPTIATDYSPVWDANLYEWTEDAIDKGYRGLLTEEFRILKLARDGFITGPNGAPFDSAGPVIVRRRRPAQLKGLGVPLHRAVSATGTREAGSRGHLCIRLSAHHKDEPECLSSVCVPIRPFRLAFRRHAGNFSPRSTGADVVDAGGCRQRAC